MSEVKHTPDPWKWNRAKKGPRGGGGGIIVWLGRHFPVFLPDTPQMEANARLFVAAPDMLAALRDAEGFVHGSLDIFSESIPDDASVGELDEYRRLTLLHKSIVAAIAKAEGRA